MYPWLSYCPIVIISIDIDECVTTSHECAHQCINTLGSFVCACDDGWELDEDGKTCEVAGTVHIYSGTMILV